MDVAEVKRKIEAQKRVSLAMKRALAEGMDSFELDGRLYMKKGNAFIETCRELEMTPREKLHARLAGKDEVIRLVK